MYNKIIIALDFKTFNLAKNLIDLLDNRIAIYKVGLEAFLNYGTELINYLNSKQKKIFLDLKFNDISNTVIQACKYALDQGVFIFTIHATNGPICLKAISELSKTYKHQNIPAAVTVLTSFNQHTCDSTFINYEPVSEYVLYLARMSISAGIKGVICSPFEVKEIKHQNHDIIAICPGIRLHAQAHDQARVMTPSQAFKQGADYIVIGREITGAIDPIKSYEEIVKDLNENITKQL